MLEFVGVVDEETTSLKGADSQLADEVSDVLWRLFGGRRGDVTGAETLWNAGGIRQSATAFQQAVSVILEPEDLGNIQWPTRDGTSVAVQTGTVSAQGFVSERDTMVGTSG